MFRVLGLLPSTSVMRASLVIMFDFPFLLLRMLRMPLILFTVTCGLLVESVSGTDGHYNSKGQSHNSSSKCSLYSMCSINEHYRGYL